MSDVIRRLLPVAAAALALAAAPSLAQTVQRGGPSRTVLDRFGLERAWTNQATIDVHSDVVRHVVADEEVVIVQTRSGLITVFDAQSGVKLWDGQLARAERYSYPATTNSRTLFVVIGSTVYARDKFRGDELWTLRLPSVPSTSPTVDDDRMYVGTLEGSAYAFDLNRVANLQELGRLPQYNYETVVWRFKTSSEITTAPVTNGKIVAFANSAGSLMAVTPATRELAFQFEANQPASAPLELVDDTLYYAAGDTNFYSLRAANGTTRWLYVAGAPIREKPHVIGSSVLLVPVHSGMYNLESESGRVLWWSPAVEQFVAASPTRFFGTDREGNLAVIDRSNGALLGTIPALGFPIRVSNDRTDRIYVASESGVVACIRERGAELPIYHRYPERRPILPLFGSENADTSGTTPEERAAEEKATEAVPEGAVVPPEAQQSLDEALAEGVQLLEAKDAAAFLRRFIPPNEIARLAPGGVSLEEEIRSKPRLFDALLESLLPTFKAAQQMAPALERNGRSATFDFSEKRPHPGAPPALKFSLIQGRWYMDKAGP